MKSNKYTALIDTGSKYNIVSETTYVSLNNPKLSDVNIFLVGFGNNNRVKPFGSFKEYSKLTIKCLKKNFVTTLK